MSDKLPPAPEKIADGENARQTQHHDLVQMVSHDIKNRLNVILGFVEMLRRGELEGPEAASALERIENNAREATNLTISFLRAEEADSEGLRVQPTEGSLNRIVEEVVRQEESRAALGQIRFQTNLDPQIEAVKIDAAMLGRALANLIDNAIHYSPTGGTIHIETHRLDEGAILVVRDHGSGIPPEVIPNIFERFGRGDKSPESVSTGLGLYIVRAIVEAHGGTISCVQPADGGTEFTIFLPTAPE